MTAPPAQKGPTRIPVWVCLSWPKGLSTAFTYWAFIQGPPAALPAHLHPWRGPTPCSCLQDTCNLFSDICLFIQAPWCITFLFWNFPTNTSCSSEMFGSGSDRAWRPFDPKPNHVRAICQWAVSLAVSLDIPLPCFTYPLLQLLRAVPFWRSGNPKRICWMLYIWPQVPGVHKHKIIHTQTPFEEPLDLFTVGGFTVSGVSSLHSPGV